MLLIIQRDNATALAEFALSECSCLCMWHRSYTELSVGPFSVGLAVGSDHRK